MAAGARACDSLHPFRRAPSEAFRRIVLQRAGDHQDRFRIEPMTRCHPGRHVGDEDGGSYGGGNGGGGNGGGGDLATPSNGGGGGGLAGGSGDLAPSN